MIADLKPYPEYQESGLPWVGQMPGHWTLAPNRAMLRRRKVLVGKRHSDFKLLSLTKGGVIVRDITTGKGKFSSDMGTSQEVRKGDLVFCLFDVPETPRTVGLSRYDGMITGVYTVFECSDTLLAAYLDSYYRAMDDRKLLSPLYSGLRNTIPPPRFLGTKTPLPPPDEQAAIVRFLNHTNQRIERTIRAKRKVIALLNEQKQVIIHRAVTRGLDSNVRLKPSGISWLGEIPEHWDLVAAKQVSQVFIPQRDKPDLNETNGYPWITPVNVGDELLKSINLYVSEYALSSAGSRVVPAGTVIASCVGRFGIASISKVSVVINQQLQAYIPTTAISAKYLRHCVQIAKPYFEMEGNSTTLAYVNRQGFGRMPLSLPPRQEQDWIELYLDKELNANDMIISRTEREIDLLREYRTRLIADVVTGKLDVREAAARLPDEIEELESFDEIDDSVEIEDPDTVVE